MTNQAKKKTLKDAKALGLIPPKEKRTMIAKVSNHVTRQIIKFAQKHHFIITPVGYSYYVASFAEFGCCPCAPPRKSCPCEESVNEVLTLGKCKCQLFWISYETYLAEKFKEGE